MIDIERPRRPLFIVAAAYVGPCGIEDGDIARLAAQSTAPPELPPVPRFVESNFPRAVSHAVEQVKAELPAAGRVGFVLATGFGDVTTTDVASRRMAAGRAHNPLLFYQSIPNSILGHLSKATNFTGPLSCISTAELLLTNALVVAELTLEDASADQILIVGVDLAPSERIAAIYRTSAGSSPAIGPPEADTAVVLAVQQQPGRATCGAWIVADQALVHRQGNECGGASTGSMRAFAQAYAAYAGGEVQVPVVDQDRTGTGVSYAILRARPQAGRQDIVGGVA